MSAERVQFGQFVLDIGRYELTCARKPVRIERIPMDLCYVPPYNVALVFAGLGETERALQWLQQAFEERDVHMPFLLDHKWDGIRSNARFQKLLSRVGFASS